MSIGNLHRWILQLPRPIYLVVRFLYRVRSWAHAACRSGYAGWSSTASANVSAWPACCRPSHRLHCQGEHLIPEGMDPVPQDAKGIEHFFLYDNTGVQACPPKRLTRTVPTAWYMSRVSKYGVPYDEIVRLSDVEIQEILNEIQIERYPTSRSSDGSREMMMAVSCTRRTRR